MKPYNYRYVKAPIVIITNEIPKKTSLIKRLFGPILMTVGSIMIANVLWPILSYQLINSPQLQRTELIAPVPKEALGSTPNKAIASKPELVFAQVQGSDLDYTKASNWFPEAEQLSPEKPGSYVLSIPSLNIENAKVTFGGEALDKSLIHYVGTALPGQLGSPVIFGHSILRQFYDPVEKNPHRYMSIFSKIMTLKTGDRIFIDYDGIKYTYEVKDKVEVHPEDLFILEQRYSNYELKLITCVPEGTYLRRGVVVAQLVDLQ
jgi:sortase A